MDVPCEVVWLHVGGTRSSRETGQRAGALAIMVSLVCCYFCERFLGKGTNVGDPADASPCQIRFELILDDARNV